MQKDICSIFISLGLISATFPMDVFSPSFVSLFPSYNYVGWFWLFFFCEYAYYIIICFKKCIFLIIDWLSIHII